MNLACPVGVDAACSSEGESIFTHRFRKSQAMSYLVFARETWLTDGLYPQIYIERGVKGQELVRE